MTLDWTISCDVDSGVAYVSAAGYNEVISPYWSIHFERLTTMSALGPERSKYKASM